MTKKLTNWRGRHQLEKVISQWSEQGRAWWGLKLEGDIQPEPG